MFESHDRLEKFPGKAPVLLLIELFERNTGVSRSSGTHPHKTNLQPFLEDVDQTDVGAQSAGGWKAEANLRAAIDD